MTHFATGNAHISVSTGSAFVTAVKYLLGYEPANSLVVAFLDSDSARIVMTARADLPERYEGFALELVPEVLRAAQRHGRVETALLGIWADADGDDEASHAVLSDVAELLGDSGVKCPHGYLVNGDRMWSHSGKGWTSETDVRSPEAMGVAAEFIGRGRRVAAGRADHLATLDRGTPEQKDAVAREIELASRDFDAMSVGPHVWRIDVEDELCEAFGLGGLQARDIARFVVAMRDPRIREPFMYRAVLDASETDLHWKAEAMVMAVSQVPDNELADVSAVLGCLLWQCGDGVRAMASCEKALANVPGHPLASIVKGAITAGLPPSTWTHVMKRFGIERLRTGEDLHGKTAC